MVLDLSPFNIFGPIECLLGMGTSHVSAFSPFQLDRFPGIFGCPNHNYAQSCHICTVKCDMTPRKLVPKFPFIEGRITRVNGGSGRLDSGGFRGKWDRFGARFSYLSVLYMSIFSEGVTNNTSYDTPKPSKKRNYCTISTKCSRFLEKTRPRWP